MAKRAKPMAKRVKPMAMAKMIQFVVISGPSVLILDLFLHRNQIMIIFDDEQGRSRSPVAAEDKNVNIITRVLAACHSLLQLTSHGLL